MHYPHKMIQTIAVGRITCKRAIDIVEQGRIFNLFLGHLLTILAIELSHGGIGEDTKPSPLASEGRVNLT